jgi:tetratricopeptide (TPR) repeat protein
MSRGFHISFISFVFILVFSAKVKSQSSQKFAEIDSIAIFFMASSTNSIPELAQKLTLHTSSEVEKVRSIYKWITTHITYDWENFKNKTFTDQSAEKVLETRMAVCEGYANLFKALCESAHIPCEVVNGYTKGADYQIGTPIDEPNHSWNVVKISGKWQLIDATWGTNDKNNRVNDYYFLPAPERLIYTHFPERAIWQLLPRRVSMYEFERKLLVYPSFFDVNLQNFNYLESLIETNLPTIYLTFSLPAYSQIEATLQDKDQIIDLQENITRKYNWISLKIDSLSPNHFYELNLYGAASDSAQNLDLLLTYYISTGKGQPSYICTPKSDFKLDSITQMPYWFINKYIENAQKGRYVTLEKLINEGLNLYPTSSWLYFRLGDVYEKLSTLDKAITAYQKAIDLSPNYYEPHYNLGVLYYNKAIDVYDSWKKMNPEEEDSKEMKKELITLLSKAKPHVIKALKLQPDALHLEKALKNINYFVN